MDNFPIIKGQRACKFRQGKKLQMNRKHKDRQGKNTNEQKTQGQTSSHKGKETNKRKERNEISKSVIKIETS